MRQSPFNDLTGSQRHLLPVDAGHRPGNGASMRVAAILVAAGSGSRFGAEMRKQFVPLAGKPVIRHAAESLAAHVTFLQPVGDAVAIGRALDGLPHLPSIAGGATRQDSVLAGLEALEATMPDAVLVHDAARPVIPAGTIPALLAALEYTWGQSPRSRSPIH